MVFDFTALLAPAAWIMAALVVLPAALIAVTALRATRTGRNPASPAVAARRRGRDQTPSAYPRRIAPSVRAG
jgi:hypothetical protein